MKIRNDFVTNSSSSSFIISKTSEYSDVEKLYQFIRNTYLEWINKKNEMIEYCKNNKEFVVTEEDGKIKIKAAKKYERTPEYWDYCKQLDKQLTDMFGMDTWDNLNYRTDWLSANTYEEYCEMTKEDKYVDWNKKPFILVDFANIAEEDKSEADSIIQWYFPCYNDKYGDVCQYCDEMDTDICKALKCDKTKLPDTIGKVCISSENGYIPKYVTDIIEEHCSQYCHHMG